MLNLAQRPMIMPRSFRLWWYGFVNRAPSL